MIVRVVFDGVHVREFECDGFTCEDGVLHFYAAADDETPSAMVKTWDACQVIPDKAVQ